MSLSTTTTTAGSASRTSSTTGTSSTGSTSSHDIPIFGMDDSSAHTIGFFFSVAGPLVGALLVVCLVCYAHSFVRRRLYSQERLKLRPLSIDNRPATAAAHFNHQTLPPDPQRQRGYSLPAQGGGPTIPEYSDWLESVHSPTEVIPNNPIMWNTVQRAKYAHMLPQRAAAARSSTRESMARSLAYQAGRNAMRSRVDEFRRNFYKQQQVELNIMYSVDPAADNPMQSAVLRHDSSNPPLESIVTSPPLLTKSNNNTDERIDGETAVNMSGVGSDAGPQQPQTTTESAPDTADTADTAEPPDDPESWDNVRRWLRDVDQIGTSRNPSVSSRANVNDEDSNVLGKTAVPAVEPHQQRQSILGNSLKAAEQASAPPSLYISTKAQRQQRPAAAARPDPVSPRSPLYETPDQTTLIGVLAMQRADARVVGATATATLQPVRELSQSAENPVPIGEAVVAAGENAGGGSHRPQGRESESSERPW
ncbi:hypothetical protein BJ742DRAFT_795072 [Cladochytrium replicatum]|nr:hypothetical protein BJ742DRAFT_795072 [Cladochytrium replicatum]